MIQTAIILFWVLIALAIGQAIYVAVFAFVMKRRVKVAQDADCPKAAVILCVRGKDPFMQDCLNAIARLDYPDYTAFIVVDHKDDPAWEPVHQMAQNFPNIQTQFLEAAKTSCGLKCSSLVQAITSLDESYEFVALLDSDTIPHQQWLRSLAAGLRPDDIGAVTGIRWYVPKDSKWGTLVRYFWNSAAIVQMLIYRICWGGTLAIKTKAIRETDLLQKWSTAFCEDTMTSAILANAGYKVTTQSDLVMANRESCNLSDLFPWLSRQLLTARLYHPKWWLVVFHGASTTLANVAAVTLLILAVFSQRQAWASWVFVGFLISQTVNYILLAWIESTVSNALADRGEQNNWLTAKTIFRMLIAVPITQVFYFAAMIHAMFLRSVNWRGVGYDIKGPHQVHMTGHDVYQPKSTTSNSDSL